MPDHYDCLFANGAPQFYELMRSDYKDANYYKKEAYAFCRNILEEQLLPECRETILSFYDTMVSKQCLASNVYGGEHIAAPNTAYAALNTYYFRVIKP